MHQTKGLELICFVCKKQPHELDEYVFMAQQENYPTPADFVRHGEATFNPQTGHFCCTECYIEIGMPTSPFGWKAP